MKESFLKPADDVIKMIQRNALYFEETIFGCKIYYPVEKESWDTKKIDGVLCGIVWSNHYESLKKFYEESKTSLSFEQGVLF